MQFLKRFGIYLLATAILASIFKNWPDAAAMLGVTMLFECVAWIVRSNASSKS